MNNENNIVASESRLEQKRGDLMVTLATYIFHLYNYEYQVQEESLRECCQKISTEAAKPSIQKLKENLQQLFIREVNEQYLPDEQNLTKALEMMFSENIIENVDLFSLGMDMVETIKKLFPENYEQNTAAEVQTLLSQLYGDYQVHVFGDDAQQNLKTIRSYQYHYKLPWIARIANRQESGKIVEEWVMVEDVQDLVLCMDPYPWDDIEEDFKLPTQEFLIRWKLCDFVGFYITKKSEI